MHVFYFWFVLAILAGAADYYQILGVPRNADQATIKKAFKKLNQRKIFDQYGDEGLKQQQQGRQQWGNGNFENIFTQFFTDGGGRRTHFNFGGGFQQREQPPQPIYENTEVIELNLQSLKQLLRRNRIWIVNFYSSRCQTCLNFKEEWLRFADKMYGIVKAGAINCLIEEELCEEYEVREYPTFLYFPENTAEDYQVYTGKKSWSDFANFASQRMSSYVILVSEFNLETFLKSTKPIIILFTDKKVTPPIYKAISKDWKDKAEFGEVKESSVTIANKFGVTKFPTLLGVQDPYTFENKKYESDIKFDQIVKWIREFYQSRQSVVVAQQYFPDKRAFRAQHCGRQDPEFCLFIVIQANQYSEISQLAVDLTRKYKKEHLKVFWLDKVKFNDFYTTLDSDITSKIIIIKGKRQKVWTCQECTIYNEEQNLKKIDIFIDSVVFGGTPGKNLKLEL